MSNLLVSSMKDSKIIMAEGQILKNLLVYEPTIYWAGEEMQVRVLQILWLYEGKAIVEFI